MVVVEEEERVTHTDRDEREGASDVLIQETTKVGETQNKTNQCLNGPMLVLSVREGQGREGEGHRAGQRVLGQEEDRRWQQSSVK